jgi:hypothetical protein
MVVQLDIARKLRSKEQFFFNFYNFLEYTQAVRHATSVCTCTAYVAGHVHHAKSCFLRGTSTKVVGGCVSKQAKVKNA